jgi:hypothetical protein
MKRAVLLAPLIGLAFVSLAHAGAYLESGDAGDISSPQATVGTGSLSNIFGTIGGSDEVDAFGFKHTDPGGFFFIGATLSTGDHVTLTLFDSSKAVVASHQDTLDLTPIPVGTYFIEIEIASGSAVASYELGFDGEAVFLETAIPEPASIGLLGSALLGLTALRRHRRARSPTP